jgi:hypothetical protein
VALALVNIPTKNGDKTNAWVEFTATELSNGVIDAGINNIIIYDDDEIPDELLDRYNLLKEAKGDLDKINKP